MSNPIRSMTGFARETRNTEYGEIVIGIKSVNHRGLDLHFHLGAETEPFEQAMREALKRAVLRGHIDIRATFVRPNGAESAGLNEPFLKVYLAAFRKIAAQEGVSAEPDLNAALRVPGMFNASESIQPDESAQSAVLSVFESAVASLHGMDRKGIADPNWADGNRPGQNRFDSLRVGFEPDVSCAGGVTALL